MRTKPTTVMTKTINYKGNKTKVNYDYSIGKKVEAGEEFVITFEDFNASYDCRTYYGKSTIDFAVEGITFNSQKKMIEHLVNKYH